MHELAIAQDIGGAIKGAHMDWYMGEGKEAGQLANLAVVET